LLSNTKNRDGDGIEIVTMNVDSIWNAANRSVARASR
jgi:hypothetical protein